MPDRETLRFDPQLVDHGLADGSTCDPVMRFTPVKPLPGQAMSCSPASDERCTHTVRLGEPRRLYDAIVGRTRFDGPIPLEQLTEKV